MARAADHIAIANRNHETLATLLRLGAAHSEWVATIAFYKAIHVVEAVFVCSGVGNAANHDERTWKLKNDRRFNHIFEHYRPLKEASTIARYLQDQRGTVYRTFTDYLAPELVHSKLIRHRLQQIETSATRFLDEDSKRNLLLCSTLPDFASSSTAAAPQQTSTTTAQVKKAP